MQKIGMVLAMLVCTMMAHAGEYAYLVFTNTVGTNTALSVYDLRMTVDGTQLNVSNAEGTVNFTLTDLARMQFSVDGSTTALENVINGDEAVTVFSMTGVSLGSFNSLLQAAGSLSAGAYVIKQGVNTQTMVIR